MVEELSNHRVIELHKLKTLITGACSPGTLGTLTFFADGFGDVPDPKTSAFVVSRESTKRQPRLLGLRRTFLFHPCLSPPFLEA